MANWINSMDAFGDTCPANWEDIASWLNDKLDELCPEFDPDSWEDREIACKLWEDFAAGDLYTDGCPVPIMDTPIYIAEVFDDNSDAYTVTFSKSAAYKQAEQYKGHLTEREFKTHTVAVKRYTVALRIDDKRTAKEVFLDAEFEDIFLGDPEEYVEI